jgi:hypothetical protein
MGWITRRGDYFPLLVLLIVSQGLRFEGRLLPLHLGGSPGSTLAPLLLFLRVLPLVFSMISCPPRHILEQGNPLGSLRRHPRPYSISTEGIKRKKEGGRNWGDQTKLKWTHPGTDDPFPQGNWPRAGASVHPEGKDPPNVGINLRIPHLGVEGAIRAVGSWIPPHCHLRPPERLDATTDKGTKEVRTR